MRQPAPAPAVAVLVLAAGRSTRMAPMNKLLAPMPDGRSLVAQTVDHAVASSAKMVLVVTGHQAEEIEAALGARPVHFVQAKDYIAGLSASLRPGMAALPAGTRAVLLCLGDMPLVEPGILDQIMAAYDPAQGREIIIPKFAGQRGNPILWGCRFFADLQQVQGDAGGRQILSRHAAYIHEISVPSDAVLRDFDDAETLACLTAHGISAPSAYLGGQKS